MRTQEEMFQAQLEEGSNKPDLDNRLYIASAWATGETGGKKTLVFESQSTL